MLLVKFFGWVLRHIKKGLSGFEWCSVQISVRFHLADQLCSTVVINPSERATAEWWEAETEYGSDVTLKGVVQDLFF